MFNSLLTNVQVSPGKRSISLPTSSNYMEVPTTLNTGSGTMPSISGSTYIEMPTTTSSTSTSSGLPTATSNHTNVTSLHRYRNYSHSMSKAWLLSLKLTPK